MKRSLLTLLLAVQLIVFTGCGAAGQDNNPLENGLSAQGNKVSGQETDTDGPRLGPGQRRGRRSGRGNQKYR